MPFEQSSNSSEKQSNFSQDCELELRNAVVMELQKLITVTSCRSGERNLSICYTIFFLLEGDGDGVETYSLKKVVEGFLLRSHTQLVNLELKNSLQFLLFNRGIEFDSFNEYYHTFYS